MTGVFGQELPENAPQTNVKQKILTVREEIIICIFSKVGSSYIFYSYKIVCK